MFNDHGPSSGVDQVYDDYGPPDRRGRAVDYDRALDPTAPPYNDFASPSDTHDHMYNDYGRPAEVRRQRYSDYGAASDSRGPRYRDESYNEYPPSGSHAQRYDYGGPNDSRDQRYHDYGPPADSRDQGYRNYGPRPGSRHQRYHGYGPSDTMYDDYDPSSYNEGYGNWDSGDWPNESYPRDCSYGPWRSHDPARNQPLPPMDQKALMAQLFTPQDNAIHVDTIYAQAMRYTLQSAAISNCCLIHGDLASTSSPLMLELGEQDIEVRRDPLPPLQISTKRIAMTLFWNRFLKGRRRGLFFSIERVCNLHQQNTCKYGVECKNVHLCRELWHEVLGGEAQANCPPPFPMPPVQRLSLEPAPEPPLQPPPPPSTHAGAPSDEGMLAGKRSRALAIVDPVSLMPVAVEPKQSKALPIVDPVTEDEVIPKPAAPAAAKEPSRFQDFLAVGTSPEIQASSAPSPTASDSMSGPSTHDIMSLPSLPALAPAWDSEAAHDAATAADWVLSPKPQTKAKEFPETGRAKEEHTGEVPDKPPQPRAKSLSPLRTAFFTDSELAALTTKTLSLFPAGQVVEARDADEFSSIAEDLKSIQDEINDTVDELKGRLSLLVSTRPDSEPGSPLSPLSPLAPYVPLPMSPASPFFMASVGDAFSPDPPSSPTDSQKGLALPVRRASPLSPISNPDSDWSRAVSAGRRPHPVP